MTRAIRRDRTECKIQRRVKQAAQEDFATEQPHRWAKSTPLGCYTGNCWICRSSYVRPRQRDWSEE